MTLMFPGYNVSEVEGLKLISELCLMATDCIYEHLLVITVNSATS